MSALDNDRTIRLSSLGSQRLRLLDCLGGNTRFAPSYFSPPPGVDIVEAFASYVTELSDGGEERSVPTAGSRTRHPVSSGAFFDQSPVPVCHAHTVAIAIPSLLENHHGAASNVVEERSMAAASASQV